MSSLMCMHGHTLHYRETAMVLLYLLLRILCVWATPASNAVRAVAHASCPSCTSVFGIAQVTSSAVPALQQALKAPVSGGAAAAAPVSGGISKKPALTGRKRQLTVAPAAPTSAPAITKRPSVKEVSHQQLLAWVR